MKWGEGEGEKGNEVKPLWQFLPQVYLVIRHKFFFPTKQPKNLDSCCKTDLDFFGLFLKGKIHHRPESHTADSDIQVILEGKSLHPIVKKNHLTA